MVSTHLKKLSQIGNLPQIGVNIKNIWNQQPVIYCSPTLPHQLVICASPHSPIGEVRDPSVVEGEYHSHPWAISRLLTWRRRHEWRIFPRGKNGWTSLIITSLVKSVALSCRCNYLGDSHGGKWVYLPNIYHGKCHISVGNTYQSFTWILWRQVGIGGYNCSEGFVLNMFSLSWYKGVYNLCWDIINHLHIYCLFIRPLLLVLSLYSKRP